MFVFWRFVRSWSDYGFGRIWCGVDANVGIIARSEKEQSLYYLVSLALSC
jgi:hypothetical protein